MGGDLADVRSWADELGRLQDPFVHRFSRTEPRETALAYMRGLIGPLERKNGWTLVEQAGHGASDRIHRLLNRIEWEADEVLDDVREYVVEHLGDRDAVLIVDDTGFLKKGEATGKRAGSGIHAELPVTGESAGHRRRNDRGVRVGAVPAHCVAVAARVSRARCHWRRCRAGRRQQSCGRPAPASP
ncbi:transposase [Streptomyces fagopyri]|uniref:transposase n=1 Tax=Streptomyces fagopyri TaxID=2662397 RepID=UPI0036AA92B6